MIFTNEILQKTKLENEQFKQAHLRAQLISLQQQISPHFLFNSLSTLKTITHESDTKNFVVQLSHVYRYLLNFNNHQVTKLSEELKFIRSYLYILHQRFEGSLDITIEVPDNYHNCLIPPLSIQLLVENAIKHNIVSPDMPLGILIHVNDKQELIIENTLQPKKSPVESTGLGLQNINDRFRLLFNKEININKANGTFTVILPLISYEHYYH
ncbi:sensor histidine kinase [Mucilaginibacter robiniae]|nr:histidine kinase [Mucilaginibacter robiniae]